MPYLNISLAAAAYWANEYWIQGFCQPVAWAGWVVASTTAAFLLWPWLKKITGLNYLLIFLMGVHFTVCVYCVLFIGPWQIITTFLLCFLVFPLLLWLPVVFGLQAVRYALTSRLPGAAVIFVLGVVALLPAQWWVEQQYQEIEAAVAKLPPIQRHQASALVKVVPRSYIAERLAGALFKYHNYEEMVFDGWRPPLHDPLVNVSLWWRAGRDANPLLVERWHPEWHTMAGDINDQAAFYHQLFPTLPIKVNCVCNHSNDGESYRQWVPGTKP